MSNPDKWIKWFTVHFAESQFVKLLTLEQECAYRKLLDAQAMSDDGYLPEDPADIYELIRGKNLEKDHFLKEIWPAIQGKFVPVTRVWIPDPPPVGQKSNKQKESKGSWEPLPTDQVPAGRIHNEKMHRSLVASNMRTAALSAGGSKSQVVQAEKREAKNAEPPKFDFETAYNTYYPKRHDPTQGFKKGLEYCKKWIETQEQFDNLVEAMQNYARIKVEEQKANDWSTAQRKQYTKSFINWLENGWEQYIPPKVEPLVPQVDDLIGMSTDEKIKYLLGKGKYIDKRPWEPRLYDSKEERERLAAEWTEDMKADWLIKFLSSDHR